MKTIKSEMTATDILNNVESWSQSDIDNHAAVVVLRDNTTHQSYIHYAGKSTEIAKAFVELMNEDAEIALAIYGAVTVTGYKLIPDEIINDINELARKIAELRRNGATDADVEREMFGEKSTHSNVL